MARRVRWHLTGKEGVYRYGGGGGCFDVVHVETNEKETRVKKKHPYPETHEQCASRCGFGTRRKLNVILRLRDRPLRSSPTDCDGILEWPDYGGKSSIVCYLNCICFLRYRITFHSLGRIKLASEWSAPFILMGQYQLQKGRFCMGLKILVGNPASGSLISCQGQ
jgi:hypothetical protein